MLDLGELVGAEVGATDYQIADYQVVFFGDGVLEVADRIDAERVGQEPGFGGELFNCRQDFGAEGVARIGDDGEEDVVDFGVGALYGLECEQLRVVFAEEDAVVIIKGEEAHAAAGDQGQQHAEDEQRPALCDYPARVAGGEVGGLGFGGCVHGWFR